MYKVIGGDKKEYGPVSADEVRIWIREGRLRGQSLAQGERGGDWRPLSDFPEFADALRVQVGQMRPGPGVAAAPADPAVWTASVLAGPPELPILGCLSRSWRLLTANLGLLFGGAFLVWLILFVCRFVPMIGFAVQWLLSGVLYGGLAMLFLKRIRGEPATVDTVFAGFKESWPQLMLVGLLTNLLTKLGLICCLIPGLYLYIAWTFSIPLVADRKLEFWPAMELSRRIGTRVWFELFGLVVLAFLPFIVVVVGVEIIVTLKMIPVVQELMRTLQSGQPDVKALTEQLFKVAQIALPFVLVTKVALLLNLPFAFGALMHAYEDLFGSRKSPSA